MAVEASHREMFYQGDASRFDNQIHTACGNKTDEIIPGSGMTDLFPTNVFKAESGVTLASSGPFSRKRLRDSSFFDPDKQQFAAFEFFNDGIASQIYQQQLEIDRFVAHHTEKVRIQIEEMQRRNAMRLTAAYELINKRLKTKEDEIHKIVEIKQSLEEKVKSMTVENQIWRELAQTNEATANALRNNLQQVLAVIHFQQQNHFRTSGSDEDAQSQCGSNFDEDDGISRGERKDDNEIQCYNENRSGRWCRKCGKEESCVLLLPCRHLCVCSLCVSSVNNCPVCNCVKSAGVQVNMG